MKEFSRLIDDFLNLLQPYRKLGYLKREQVEGHFPHIYIGTNETIFIIVFNPINPYGPYKAFEGFDTKWLGLLDESVPKATNGPLQLQVTYKQDEDKFYILGEDLNVVQIFYALPKAWYATEEKYYSVRRHTRDSEKRNVSYTNNYMNRIALAHFQSCVNEVNNKYGNQTITNRLRSRSGMKILGYTTPITFPEKVQKKIEELNLELPGKNGPVRFGTDGKYKYLFNIDGVRNEIIDEIYPTICNIYPNVYCKYLVFAYDNEQAKKFGFYLADFLKSNASIAGLTYGDTNDNNYHARLLVKNGTQLELYDPWIQGVREETTFDIIQEGLKVFSSETKRKYILKKIDTAPEQTDFEGSCVLNSLCRVITAAEGNVRKKNLEEWVPVFVQMIVKHYRGSAMEESIVTNRITKLKL